MHVWVVVPVSHGNIGGGQYRHPYAADTYLAVLFAIFGYAIPVRRGNCDKRFGLSFRNCDASSIETRVLYDLRADVARLLVHSVIYDRPPRRRGDIQRYGEFDRVARRCELNVGAGILADMPRENRRESREGYGLRRFKISHIAHIDTCPAVRWPGCDRLNVHADCVAAGLATEAVVRAESDVQNQAHVGLLEIIGDRSIGDTGGSLSCRYGQGILVMRVELGQGTEVDPVRVAIRRKLLQGIENSQASRRSGIGRLDPERYRLSLIDLRFVCRYPYVSPDGRLNRNRHQ